MKLLYNTFKTTSNSNPDIFIKLLQQILEYIKTIGNSNRLRCSPSLLYNTFKLQALKIKTTLFTKFVILYYKFKRMVITIRELDKFFLACCIIHLNTR